MGNKYDGPERRRAPRVRAEFIVIYRVDSPMEVRMWVGNREVNAMMLDLSGLGMAILTDFDIPTLSILSIKFTLINLYAGKQERVRLIEMTGEVRNNALIEKNKYRLGIAFTKITTADKIAIDNFVKMAMSQ